MLYSFQGGNDGANPEAEVVFDPAGNLYGTALYGGQYSAGTVFSIDAGRLWLDGECPVHVGRSMTARCLWAA